MNSPDAPPPADGVDAHPSRPSSGVRRIGPVGVWLAVDLLTLIAPAVLMVAWGRLLLQGTTTIAGSLWVLPVAVHVVIQIGRLAPLWPTPVPATRRAAIVSAAGGIVLVATLGWLALVRPGATNGLLVPAVAVVIGHLLHARGRNATREA